DLYPESRRCLTCCKDCGIRFFTHPRNAGRTDLCCPFGCRAERRRRQTNERSRDHYRTEFGRARKKARNRGRGRRSAQSAAVEPPPGPETPEDLGPDMIAHIQVVTSIIERRRVSRDETIALIRWVLRQRSMGFRRRGGYGARQTRGKSRGG
ncbi:MAG: hypothetical protein JXQ29_14475, partial [Planctomycetes bacterium]|nr:hypothetical protein [Planctomycetota bacterium]